MSANEPEAPTAPDTANAAPDDDMRRRFREALERKHGNDSHGSSGHDSGKAPAPSSNEKRQRNFRRKSGG